jgi:thiol:disulfide interchange protein DsbC
MKIKNILRTALVSAAVVCLGAGSAVAADAGEVEQQIRNSLQVLLPGVVPDSVSETPIPGIYEVMFGPRLMYITGDGRYVMQGSLIDLEKRENLTEPRLKTAKLKAIEAIGEDKMIIFGPSAAKHTITVFTDVDCGYCRKLHSEIDQYNDLGIRVRYLLYPRAGERSDSYNKAVSAWCADDRKAALTASKQGKKIESRTCDNPVDEHLALGRQFGLQGTPTIVLESGETIPGYVPASKLIKALEQDKVAAGH